MDEKLDIIAIGEGLVELSADESLKDAKCLYKYFGGDVLSTAVAAVRLGSKAGFVTKLGNDAFKDFLYDGWKAEGLDVSKVSLVDEKNGLYLIARTDLKDKEFAYYRNKTAPAKLSLNDIDAEYINNSKVVYSTGITQSLSMSAREVVKKSFELAHNANILTAYDPNFNRAVFSLDDAREFFDEVVSETDILFLSEKHDLEIMGIESVDAAFKYLWDKGVSTVIIKSGTDMGYYLGYNGSISFTEFYTTDVCDTTCSGDVFNGGFLHGVTHGCTMIEAAKLASIVAGMQAQGIGAIKSIPYHDKVYSVFKGV